MQKIGLIKEGKKPVDNRVALTPTQCDWISKQSNKIKIVVQSSEHRCFRDDEYRAAGIEVKDDVSDCDIFLGIKEVPVSMLIPGKTYLFFSHTRKEQLFNQQLFHSILDKKITLIDYECMEHEDGQRMLGFGFFAGIVGAHNGMMAYGNRTGLYNLQRVYKQKNLEELLHTYFGLRLPPVKIAVTGSGRVTHGILEIMNLLGIHEVEPDEYLARKFPYPVYTQLKGANLYRHKTNGRYNRVLFHEHPEDFIGTFSPYTEQTDILMNGIFWDNNAPRLFEKEQVTADSFSIKTISDITDDANGSVPINLGDQTIEEPVYGVDRKTFVKTAPYLPGSIDVLAVGNLPNELPRDASRYFGEQLIKFVLEGLINNNSAVIERATMVKKGVLTSPYSYLKSYAGL
jgi:saccharopine dehydrogenase (NAD+, L-lysine forming)